MNYIDMKLSECCMSITDGDHLPPPKASSGIPFITISNITDKNDISFNNTMFVPQYYYDALPVSKKAKVGDILYSVVGSFGKPVYIREKERFVFQRHIAILRPNKWVDGCYLYYAMLNPVFYKQIDKLAIGCSQRTVTLDALRNISITMPELYAQKVITKVLSVIDEKIRNNDRINDNLPYQSSMVA